MVALRVFIVLLLSAAGVFASYTCSCYCYSSTNYVGQAYSSTCSSTACQSACYYNYNYCNSFSYTYGTCITSATQSYVPSYSYSNALTVGTIIGIVIGSLAGVAVLVTIIVVIVIVCKRRPTRLLAVQPHPQQLGHVSVIQGPGQQWNPNYYHQPPIGSMNNMNSQYPPAYMPAQPIKIQA